MKSKKSIILIIASVATVIIIHFIFNLHPHNEWWVAKWGAGDLLTYLGTMALGWLAIMQNEELKKSNEESEKQLKDINEKANEINVISKIIEYEIAKKATIESAFEDFEKNCNPQKYVSSLNKIDDKHIEVDEKVVFESEMELDESYLKLCTKMGLKMGEVKEGHVSTKMKELYTETKGLINLLKHKELDSVEAKIDKIKKARIDFGESKNLLLFSKQKELDELIRGDVRLAEIKAIY